MSEPQACRRVNAALLLDEFPEIDEKLNSGELSLTTASLVYSFFRKEDFTREEKLEILAAVEGAPTREVERILIARSSRVRSVIKDRVRRVSNTEHEMQVTVDEDTIDDIERLKEIWAHEIPDGNLGEIIKKMASYCREKLDPLRKAERAQARKFRQDAPTAPKVSSRAIPMAVEHAVRQRDGDQCTFVDPNSGERCDSRRFVQCDHIVPYAMGGQHTVENLRMRCFAHNQRHALEIFGPEILKYGSQWQP